MKVGENWRMDFDVWTSLRQMSIRQAKPLAPPRKVIFLLTNRCPLRCVMCWTHDAAKGTELGLDDLLSAVRQAAAFGVEEVMFSGGEPLLRREEVRDLVALASSLGLHTSLLTSSFFPDPEILLGLWEAGLNVVMTSLDGPDAAMHDAIRGFQGSHGRIGELLEAAVGFRGRPRPWILDPALRDRFYVGTITTILRQNYDRLVETYHWAAARRVDFVNFQAVILTGANEQLAVPAEGIGRLAVEIEALDRLRAPEGLVQNSSEFLRAIPTYFERRRPSAPVECEAGYTELVVGANGWASTCLGDLPPDATGRPFDLVALWKSEAFREARERMSRCTRVCAVGCWRETRGA